MIINEGSLLILYELYQQSRHFVAKFCSFSWIKQRLFHYNRFSQGKKLEASLPEKGKKPGASKEKGETLEGGREGGREWGCLSRWAHAGETVRVRPAASPPTFAPILPDEPTQDTVNLRSPLNQLSAAEPQHPVRSGNSVRRLQTRVLSVSTHCAPGATAASLQEVTPEWERTKARFGKRWVDWTFMISATLAFTGFIDYLCSDASFTELVRVCSELGTHCSHWPAG